MNADNPASRDRQGPSRPPEAAFLRWRGLPTVILALYLTATVTLSAVNPLGEGYDEWAHFAYIRYLVTERRLPASGQRLVPEVAWDATHHPPLYHLVGAATTFWVDYADNLRPFVNPHAEAGLSLNAYVHTDAEAWPWRGSALGMHVARGVSVLMGLVTLVLTYRIGRLLMPARRDLAAAALGITAFMPQFVFTHSIITNDAAVTLFATLALWLMLRLALSGGLWNGVGAWAAIAAAFMSKANGVALIPVGAAVTLWAVRGNWGRLQPRVRAAVAALGVLAVVATLVLLGAWERRNTYLETSHSSVTGAITRFILPALTGNEAAAVFDWSVVPAGIAYSFRTFWAAFGVGNVPVDAAYYGIVAVACLLALAGLTRLLWARRHALGARVTVTALTGTALLVPPLFLIPVSRLSYVAPGRYLMPLAPIVGLALAAGLASVCRQRPCAWLPWVSAVFLLAVSLVSPWRTILPAYAQPPRLNEAQLAERATPLGVRFGDSMELAGYTVGTDTLEPGDPLDVWLYWRCLEPMGVAYSVAVQALGPELHNYGGTVNYPGRGSYPTTLWEPGEIIEDRHRLTVGEDLAAPAYVRIKVDVYELGSYTFLPVTAPAEQAGGTATVFGRIRVSETSAGPAPAPLAGFGDAIALEAAHAPALAHAGESVAVELSWRATAGMDRDYTVFVHLLDAGGTIVAQADGPPVDGRFPTTLWRAGDRVAETRSLPVPPGTAPGSYRIAVGWYLLDTLERLPAAGAAGVAMSGAQYTIPLEITSKSVAP